LFGAAADSPWSVLPAHPVVVEAGMANDLLGAVRGLPDGELASRVRALAGREREATAELVAHLGELEVRDLHLQAGYGSLFAYCRDALALAEHEAFNRIEVARAVRRFPAILERLAEGAVNLTAVRLLAPYLTPDNHRGVLESARGKRRSQVEEIVARLFPVPDVPPSLRKLPPPRPAPWPSTLGPPTMPPPEEGAPEVTFTRPVWPPLARPAGGVAPLSPERYRLQVTIGGETLERLRLAKDMLRHAIPSGDDAAVLDRALVALLADLARKKFAATEQPRPSRGTAPGSRHIPAEVKRTVWLRDLGRCAFRAPDGRRCSERGFVEFHHVRPYAESGEASVANIQLRCRRHNDYEARVHAASAHPSAPSPG
jgi:hypothetical protein